MTESRELPRAAYVPFDPELGFDAAVDRAATYLGQAADHKSWIVIVPLTNTVEGSSALKRYAQGRDVLTPRNAGQRRLGYGHPALVYVPALKELQLATQYTADRPIAVVEHPSFSCARWADEIGALNLLEMRVQEVEPRVPQHQKLLERIDFAGNNGWGDDYGKRDLRRHLAELHALGLLDKEEIVAYQLVRGRHHHYDALEHLCKEVDALQTARR